MRTIKTKAIYAWLTYILLVLVSCNKSPSDISLAGDWRFALDPEDVGVSEQWAGKELSDNVRLPGSLQEQGKGYPVDLNTNWTGQVVDSSWYTSPVYEKYRQPGQMKVPFWLNPERVYVGVAWYQREIDVPADWENKTIILELERTHWETSLYVDGKEVGKQDALLTPHRYSLEGLKAGKHVLALRVDNRVRIHVGMNAHSVSDHTQSNWNGIIGKMTLSVKPSVYLENIQVYPDIKKKNVRVKVNLEGNSNQKASLALRILSAGKQVGKTIDLEIQPGDQAKEQEFVLELGEEALLWSEHTPNVYQMCATVQVDNKTDEKSVDFGFREFKPNGTHFEINGQQTFLRGTLECCIFPLTGYPAMENDYWVKIYRAVKDHGLNHVRFHSWCPPEAAFHVADSMGVYLQVECGGWASVGDGEPQDEWFRKEGDRILKEYGNHPSFCMMAYGNEPGGANQVKYLSELVDYWKSKDNRRVYTSSGGWPYIENADYWNAPDPRIQGWGAGLSSIINREAPRTDYDFRTIIKEDMPTVSHEIGQWCVYPNFKEISKYTGVLKAKNFEIFEASLKSKGMEELADKFLFASGRLQTLCYKADIEAALRTPGFAGFQLLDLHDFPGQGTALVGVLDPFWESKGYVEPEEYRSFCNVTVPLVRFPKMVWLNNETLDVPLEMAHFGEQPLQSAHIRWKLSNKEGNVLKDGVFEQTIPLGNGLQIGNITCDLSPVQKASQLVLSVDVEGTDIHNQWNIWVYPAIKEEVKQKPYITAKLDNQAKEILNQGGSVLLLTYGKVPQDKGGDIAVGFSSIFWNTAWTRKQAPHTLGVYCKADHPALSAFPNEGVSDYQWWDLMSRCQAMVLDEFPKGFSPVVYVIDDWFTNRKLGLLYETRVNGGKLMVCSADLQNDLPTRPSAAQFRQSILEYMASGQFNPTQELTWDDLVRQSL